MFTAVPTRMTTRLRLMAALSRIVIIMTAGAAAIVPDSQTLAHSTMKKRGYAMWPHPVRS